MIKLSKIVERTIWLVKWKPHFECFLRIYMRDIGCITSKLMYLSSVQVNISYDFVHQIYLWVILKYRDNYKTILFALRKNWKKSRNGCCYFMHVRLHCFCTQICTLYILDFPSNCDYENKIRKICFKSKICTDVYNFLCETPVHSFAE
jgi:hypothetical protein